ncbi:MAG TPA: hypothetical protein VLL48_13175, partial [Longimicrobiales bacterium]|nr:hypothetical protein [Longimicrobiales bacterium]
HSILCSVHIAAGSWEEAERSCDRVRRGDDGYSLSLGILRAHQGRRAEAAQQLDRDRRAGGGETVQPVIAAMVYAGLGDADTALTLLTRAVDEGYPHAEYLSNHPFFDPLQDDPRYQALLARLKLPGRT